MEKYRVYLTVAVEIEAHATEPIQEIIDELDYNFTVSPFMDAAILDTEIIDSSWTPIED